MARDDLAVGGIVVDDEEALAAQLCGDRRELGAGGRLRRDREVEGGPLAGLALDPRLSAHHLAQALADREAQAGAAVPSRR